MHTVLPFPTLPPEIWELIICNHMLLNKKYINTIKQIPSKHNIIDTTNIIIQKYIDYICKLFYSIDSSLIKNILYIKNLKDFIVNIINYFLDDIILPTITHNDYYNYISINNYNKTVKIYKLGIVYLTDNEFHRIDGPAVTYWYANGNKQIEMYYINDGRPGYDYDYTSIRTNSKLHRTDGPAITTWYKNKTKSTEEYYIYHIKHRIGGPAVTSWYKYKRFYRLYQFCKIEIPVKTGVKALEIYYNNGKMDNLSYTKWNVYGNKIEEGRNVNC